MSKLARAAVEAIDGLRALLAEEERVGQERSDALLKDKTHKELEAAGVLLRRARVLDVSPALFSRVRVVVGDDPSRPHHSDRFDVRAGQAVWLLERDDDGTSQRVAAGVVARRTRGRIEVVFESDESVGALTESVDLVRGEDAVTLRRMRDGLNACASAEGRTGRLVEIVLGAMAGKPTRLPAAPPPLLDAGLNADQQRAVQHALFNDDIALIHGPPGTGKTRVLVEVIRAHLRRGESVLALSASNAAVDHLALSVLDADADAPLIRLGQPARVSPQLENHTLAAAIDAHERRQLAKDLVDQAFALLRQARRRSDRSRDAWQREREVRAEAGRLFADARRLERQAAHDVLDHARVLCGTLTSLRDDVLGDRVYDVLVVDEASQVLTPALLLGVLRAKRVVLAGDHKQLPPTVISPRAERDGLGRTVFAAQCTADAGGERSHMLTVQHRMHAALMAFPSTHSYGGKLTAHPSVAGRTLLDLGLVETSWTLPARPLDFIDTAGSGLEERSSDTGDSRDNPGEAGCVARVVRALLAEGLPASAIGVVTPYAAQVAELEQLLDDVLNGGLDGGLEVDSVDGFQGREKEAIVFSAVRSNSDGNVGFLADARRLNVAITRAKRKLVLVGDSATLANDSMWRALIDHAIAAGAYRSIFELPEDAA